MKVNSYVIIGGILVLLLALGGVRVLTHKRIRPKATVVLYDPSISKGDGCACLTQKFKEAMEKGTADKEEIQLWRLGDQYNGYKPKPVDKFSVYRKISFIYSVSNAEQDKQKLLTDFEAKCRSIQRTDSTPLYAALETSVEQLKSVCDPESSCEIITHTDMEESVDPRILAAFKKAKSGGGLKDLPKIDNSHIKITFTGVAEIVTGTAPQKKSGKKQKSGKDLALEKMNDDEIWESLWKGIFTDAGSVASEQICSP